MVISLKNNYLLLAAMLLLVPLFQACSDDPADPADPNAKNVNVRLVDRNCYGPILQILDPHYAAYGREEYVDQLGKRIRVIIVAKSVVNWEDIALNSVHYVDLERVSDWSPNTCVTLDAIPHAYVDILKVY